MVPPRQLHGRFDRTFAYGDPFQAGGAPWDEFVSLDYSFNVPVLAPGAQVPANLLVGFTARFPVAALVADGTIAPVIAPVRNVQIGGMDAMAPRAGVGLTPVVTWDPPAIGAPTGYNAQVEDVTTDASNQTVLDDVADVTTTSTRLAIPPSILVSGHSYLLVISADLLPGADVVAAPLLATGVAPHHHARLATAQFTP